MWQLPPSPAVSEKDSQRVESYPTSDLFRQEAQFREKAEFSPSRRISGGAPLFQSRREGI
jgi:hypothetical protein